MIRILVCAVLLCITAALIFAMRRARGNPDSIFAQSLFRVKSVRVLPVISFVYAFYAAAILFFGLQAAEIASGLEYYLQEDNIPILMSMEKQTEKYDYPLVAIKGRDSIGEKEKPRVLVVGDSFVWGYGASNLNQLWWNVMARELERRGYDCEVYAVGFVEETSTYDEFCWLKDTTMLEDIQPDVIIMGYVSNDPDLKSLGMGLKTYYAPVPGPAHRLFSSLFPGLSFVGDSKRMVRRGRSENPYNNAEYGYTMRTWEEKLVEEGNLEKYNAYVVQPLGEFVRAIGIPLLVIPTPEDPVASACYIETHHQRVLPLFEQAGLPVYNPLALFAEQYSDAKYAGYYRVSPVNTHLGPATSLFLGQYAADVLEQEYGPILAKNGDGGEQNTPAIEINDWMPYGLSPQSVQESDFACLYAFLYPSQQQEPMPFKGPFGGEYFYDGFLRLPNGKKYVKLNFKYPVRISSVRIDGKDLLSAEVYTLAVNEALGFDDQKPVRLGKRRGTQCVWGDGSGRYITSLLINAKTNDKAPAYLSISIESQGGEEAFY